MITELLRYGKFLGGTGGASSWNDLKDKPFYEETKVVNEPLDITFNSMDGLETIVFDPEDDMYGKCYKLADAVMTADQFKNLKMDIIGNTFGEDFTSSVADYWDVVENEGTPWEWRDVVITDELLVCSTLNICVALKDNAVWRYKEWVSDTEFVMVDVVTFPTKGIYCLQDWTFVGKNSMRIYAPEVSAVKTVVRKLDKKWLPNTVLYVDDTYLYHDAELTTKVSREELLAIGIGQLFVVRDAETELALNLLDDTDRGRTLVTTLQNTYYTSEYTPR